MALYYAHNEAWPSFQILINLEGANITKTIPYIRIPTLGFRIRPHDYSESQSIRLRTFYLFYPAKILLISWYMINTVRFHVEKLICLKKTGRANQVRTLFKSGFNQRVYGRTMCVVDKHFLTKSSTDGVIVQCTWCDEKF